MGPRHVVPGHRHGREPRVDGPLRLLHVDHLDRHAVRACAGERERVREERHVSVAVSVHEGGLFMERHVREHVVADGTVLQEGDDRVHGVDLADRIEREVAPIPRHEHPSVERVPRD